MAQFKQLRESRNSSFSSDRYKYTAFDFEGKERRVYTNANLSIFTNESCNANCSFCVDQLRFENKGKTFVKSRIADDEEYFKRLEYVLKTLRPLNTSISVTGGEPTKSRRLIRILQLIEKYGFRKRVITTNGSGLLDVYDNKFVLQYIIDAHFDHLNISKTHFHEDTNAKLMLFDNSYFTNEQMEYVVRRAIKAGVRPRLSCLLLKEGIHDVEGITKYLDFYGNMGVDNIIFRETMDYDESAMRNRAKMDFLRRNKIYLDDVWEEMEQDPRFAPLKQVLGYYYYVEIYKYKRIDVCMESANLRAIDQQKSKAPDTVFEMIFHPNGNLCGSWVEDEDILMRY